MKMVSIILLIVLFSSRVVAQSADSVTLNFRAYQANSATMFVPGQFNNWGNNSGGVISSSDGSRMLSYNTLLGCWLKSYTFKIHASTDTRRTMADSVFEYKFNMGGGSSGWYADPLNSEINSAENSNSVLRLSKLFWFEYNQVVSGNNISRITVGLVHANSDNITSITLSYGTTQGSTLTTMNLLSAYSTTSRILDTSLTTQIPKANYIRLVAYNNHGDSAVFSKGGYVWTYMALPSYVKNGVTLGSAASNDSVSFRLRVSNKDYVLLRIAPVGSPVATATPIIMRHNYDNDNWWVNVKLTAGTYEYVYEIENGKQIYDPWGRNNGDNGTRFTVGSEGLTGDDYLWNSTNYQRPPLNKLIIYEMNLMEFAGGYYGLNPYQMRWFRLRNLLGYLDSLGINAIELMPVTDYGTIGSSGFSWGYDVNSYFALEPTFGTPKDFKEFIDSAHTRGIAVIMDMVLNHQNETGALWQMQPDESSNPYFKLCTDLKPNEDNLCFFKDMDYWTPSGSSPYNYSEELVYTALKMWIDDYHIDGFRYDYTQGIGWSRFDTAKGVLGFTNRIAKDYNNTVYQIAEHLPESPALIYYSGLTSSWHGNFREKLMGEATGSLSPLTDFENLILGLGSYGTNDTPTVPNSYANRTEPVNDCSNHDEQSLLFEMIYYQHVDTATAYLRDKLYSTFMFTSLGIPMLWEGNEMGEPRGYTNNKLDFRPVQWSFLATARGQSQYKHYHTLIMQRKLNPALYNGVLVTQYRYESSRVLVWGFKDTVSGNMIQAIANLTSTPRTVTNVPWLATGTWYDIYTQSAFVADSTTLDSLTVPAYTALVYSNKTNGDLGIPVGVMDNQSPAIPREISLAQNYPNPFNPSTTIHFELPGQTHVILKIYDIMGREVATLVDEQRHAGVYDVHWNAGQVASGIYFYRLTTGETTQTKKLVLIR